MFSELFHSEFWQQDYFHLRLWYWCITGGILCSYIAGFYSAAHALLRVRSPQGTIAWVICLVLWPFISVPAYWIFRQRKYEGYVSALRRASIEHRKFALERMSNMTADRHVGLSESLRQIEYLSLFPFMSGNTVQLLINSGQTYPAMIAAMRRARYLIAMQFFIVKDDGIGCRFRDVMVERAQAGVRVILLYDPISSSMSRKWLAELEAAGVQVRDFKAARRRDNLFRINFRNHRKILTIDGGEEAFTGGLNIADEYDGRGPLGFWRDTFVHVCGPAARTLHLVLEGDWFWATGHTVDVRRSDRRHRRASTTVTETPSQNGTDPKFFPLVPECSVMVFPNSPADEHENATMMLTQIIHNAKHSLRLCTPYLIPDAPILNALKTAIRRGVKVDIIIPDTRDHWLAWLAAFSYADELKEFGANVMRYQKGFIHQKLLIADDELTLVGTNNMDYRSLYLNFEISVLMADLRFTAQAITMFEADLEECRPAMTPRVFVRQPILWRLVVNIARMFAPIL